MTLSPIDYIVPSLTRQLDSLIDKSRGTVGVTNKNHQIIKIAQDRTPVQILVIMKRKILQRNLEKNSIGEKYSWDRVSVMIFPPNRSVKHAVMEYFFLETVPRHFSRKSTSFFDEIIINGIEIIIQ